MVLQPLCQQAHQALLVSHSVTCEERTKAVVNLNLSLRASVTIGLLLLAAQSSAIAQRAAKPKPTLPELEQVIQQYILDHPEVVLESVGRFQLRQEEAKRQQAREAVAQHERDLTTDPTSPVAQATPQSAGKPVTVVEFFDYRCGYCKKVDSTVTGLASAPGVRVVYKELPILGPESMLAAQAALAADKQGKYQPFHQALMSGTDPITPESLATLATTLGLDPVRLKADMASPDIAATLARNQELAGKLGVQSTPTFVIGNDIIPGAISAEAFQPLIQAARQQAKAAVQTPTARQ